MEQSINIKKLRKYKIILTISLAAGLIIMFFPGVFNPCKAYLTEKANQVLGLTMLSSSIATGISLLPGDAGMPIANMLVNFSGILLVILIGITLEKYLLVLGGGTALLLLIPASMLIYIKAEYSDSGREQLRKLASKFLTFGLVISLVVPISIGLSSVIDHIYDNPVIETIDSGTALSEETEKLENEGEEQNLWDQIVNGVTGGINSVVDGVSGMVEQAKQTVNRMIESIAVMTATCLLIPILVYLILYWLLRQIFGSKIPDLERIGSDAVKGSRKAKAVMSQSRKGSKHKKQEKPVLHELSDKNPED